MSRFICRLNNPLIDVYDNDADDGEAVLLLRHLKMFSALIRLYEDVQLVPVELDVRALCNLRFLKSTNLLKVDQTYLVVDWSVEAASMSIYSDGHVDFLRYQSIGTSTQNWRYIMTNRKCWSVRL